jgi:hypothetical protein
LSVPVELLYLVPVIVFEIAGSLSLYQDFFMRTKRSVRKRISEIEPGDHLCSIFDTAEDQFAIISDLISTGVERNEKTLLLTDFRRPVALATALRSLAVPVVKLTSQGKFVFMQVDSIRHDASWLYNSQEGNEPGSRRRSLGSSCCLGNGPFVGPAK